MIQALGGAPRLIALPPTDHLDMLDDDDAQLALTCCYELHYESFVDVDEAWEWAPELLFIRNRLEQAFLRRLEDEVGAPTAMPAGDVVPALVDLALADGPSLSRFIDEEGCLYHLREFCVHRSEYQRKEADPHTWMIPRLRGRAKAAAVTIQYDEYGEGSAPAMHAELFATTMEALDLDPTYGAYRDLLPAATLATGNLVTMFGLHRRWRAACVGHLALFEMTSVTPMTRYSSALKKFGLGPTARRFYDVHVEADAWHEQVAQGELIAGLLELEPSVGGTVVFGARSLMEVERRLTATMLDAWEQQTTSLLAPLPDVPRRVLTPRQERDERKLLSEGVVGHMVHLQIARDALGYSQSTAFDVRTQERNIVDEPTAAKRSLVDRIQGKVKEVAGNLVGDRELTREGQLHQERAAATAKAAQLEAEAAQADEEANVVAREQELIVESRELAAEGAVDARAERLEREAAEERLRIERERAAAQDAIARSAEAEKAAVVRDEAAAIRERAEHDHEAAVLEAEAQKARATAEALTPSTNDESKGPST